MKNRLSHKISILTAAVLAIILVCAAFSGCAETAVSETGKIDTTPVVTPSPAPKVGLDAVFGKENITIAAISNGTEEQTALFFAGAQAEAQSLGITLDAAATGENFSEAVKGANGNVDAIIACLINKQSDYSALDNLSEPATLFEMQNGNVSESVSHIYYTPDSEASLAFDAALTYPPHDTPVRLILMFESKETESYALYQQLADQGKIFPKEVYIASEEDKPAGDWLTEKLDGYVEGMLDGVYAENTALALNALDALEALNRTDMEVFCPGVTAETVERMQNDPEVFAQSVGPNLYLAGVLSVRAALKEIKGEGNVTLGLEPVVINASDLKTSGVQAFTDLYGEAAATWNEGWMDGLREYYKGTIPN